jgi:hypothetical protein
MLNSQLTFVTSFSQEGFYKYAKNMLESVADKWHTSLKLVAYYHDCDKETVDAMPKGKNIEYRNLNLVQDMLNYRDRMKVHDGTEGGNVPYNWRLDAIKWCHKVYAMTDLAFEMMEKEAQAG